ncbi:DUF2975 domain-containing protein [Roseibium sp.]|uniref:DUF2975 domain-containing protein n=2 Tax=Roseibium sp. TaxID=1936156 RepID=UPI003BAF05FD
MTQSNTATRKKQLRRIQLTSMIMKWTSAVMLAVLLVFAAVVVIGAALPKDQMLLADEVIYFEESERLLADVPQTQRIALSFLNAFSFAMLIGAAWNVHQIFRGFQNADFFAPRTLSKISAFGLCLIVFAVFELLGQPVASFVITYDYPPADRSYDIECDGGEVFFFILGTLMLLFGWILREAALIADENRQFV